MKSLGMISVERAGRFPDVPEAAAFLPGSLRSRLEVLVDSSWGFKAYDQLTSKSASGARDLAVIG